MSSDKQLCIATGIFPPDTGGPAKFAQSFIEWAQKRTIPISVISLTDSDDYEGKYNGAAIQLISREHRFILRFIKTMLLLRRKFKNQNMILANGLFLETLIAALTVKGSRYFTKVPGDIVWERARNSGYTNLSIDAFQTQNLNLKWRLFRFLFTKSLRKSEKVIVPSLHIENLCIDWGLPKSKLVLINNSIDTMLFSPSEDAKEWDVVTVCRLVPWKGVDEIIKTCAELSLSLCIVGSGPERSLLEKLSKSTGLHANFTGELDQTEIRGILGKSRCLVLNSSFEATSYALLEARSMGLFTIARKNTGSEEVINHGVDGLLCDTSFPLLLALKQFSTDENLVSKASKLGRLDTMKRFDLNVNYQRIYQTVMR